ncbi:MAG: class I SAM-dependent methyltransferase [Bdellovibrionaceae bacterium]|nr:class I SAM-dependent methyltransferase [Pseudobdellovibrionaceae bacterium]
METNMKLEKTNTQVLAEPTLGVMDKIIRTLFLKKMSTLETGKLEIIECFNGFEKHHIFGSKKSPDDLHSTLKIFNPQFYSRILFGGSIGAGESYIDKDWETSNLAQLIQLFARNRDLQTGLDKGLGWLMAPSRKIYHLLNKNSISGSKKNIHAHYDLGNDFFKLFLDKNWMYSAAIFKTQETSLDDAQFEKVDRICRKLKLKPDDRVIEIGTGWGGFALHAAKHYGCHVTTTTISKEQYKVAVDRIEQAGLSDRVTILLQDYRLLEGTYDKLVSIEMIEAVGLNFLETYFTKCSSLLKPHGEFLLQAITIRDQNFIAAKKSVDFIQRYIFPGSGIPSIESIINATSSCTDLQLAHLEDFGFDYAKTLHIWNDRLETHKNVILQQGYPESLHRMWQFYFGYCEGGFLERSIGVSQIHFLKPDQRIDIKGDPV